MIKLSTSSLNNIVASYFSIRDVPLDSINIAFNSKSCVIKSNTLGKHQVLISTYYIPPSGSLLELFFRLPSTLYRKLSRGLK